MGKCYCGVHKNGHCSSGAGGELNCGIHKNEYCLAGTGGRLNCFGMVTVDRNRSRLWMWRVPISVGFWIIRGPKSDWACAIGLQFGPWVWIENWAQAQFLYFLLFLLFLLFFFSFLFCQAQALFLLTFQRSNILHHSCHVSIRMVHFTNSSLSVYISSLFPDSSSVSVFFSSVQSKRERGRLGGDLGSTSASWWAVDRWRGGRLE